VPDGDAQCLVVEVDMGTLPLPRFRRKAGAFELALRQGVSARAFGRAEFVVLVLARDAARLERLRGAARREVPEERWAWWSFATAGMLIAERFGGCEWLTLEGRRTPLPSDGAGSAAPFGEPDRGTHGSPPTGVQITRFPSC
jgi:hypothetical protein